MCVKYVQPKWKDFFGLYSSAKKVYTHEKKSFYKVTHCTKFKISVRIIIHPVQKIWIMCDAEMVYYISVVSKVKRIIRFIS